MLPVDVLHIIISYLATNEYCPILKFRTICRDWKNVGDRSLIWLNCSLFIQAPRIYYTQFGWYADIGTIFIGIHQDLTTLKNRSKRIVVKNFVTNSPLQATTTSEPLFDQAYRVSTSFLQKYRLCHEAWRRYLSIYMFLKVFDEVSEEWFNSMLFRCCCGVSTALLAVGAYLLSSLPNFPTSLTLGENFGFACIYINGVYYLINWLLNYLGVVGGEMRYNSEIDLLKPLSILFNQRHVNGYILMESLHLIALIMSFVLLHCSLSSSNNPVKYSYIIIPLFCATLICIIIVITMERLERISKLFILSSFCLIYISIFLVGLYYDSSSHPGIASLDVAFIPLYFLAGILVIVALSCTSKTFWLWRDCFFKGERILSESFGLEVKTWYYKLLIFLRLFANFTVTASSWLILLLFFNIASGGLFFSLTLATSLVSVVMMFLLVQTAVFGFKSDNLYLH